MSAPLRYLLFAIVLLAVAGGAGEQYASKHPMTAAAPAEKMYATRQVMLGTTPVVADVADTEALREQGLSGRPSLEPGRGMLFVFDAPGRWGFWMKDMQFPLDIIWAAPDGTIVSIDSDLSPDTYPQVFYPDAAAAYVLEVPAGFARLSGIAPGMALVIK